MSVEKTLIFVIKTSYDLFYLKGRWFLIIDLVVSLLKGLK